jgi:hypothetical protein
MAGHRKPDHDACTVFETVVPTDFILLNNVLESPLSKSRFVSSVVASRPTQLHTL